MRGRLASSAMPTPPAGQNSRRSVRRDERPERRPSKHRRRRRGAILGSAPSKHAACSRCEALPWTELHSGPTGKISLNATMSTGSPFRMIANHRLCRRVHPDRGKKAWLACASTRTCTSTRNIPARPAAISISSISPHGPAARASAWSPPATSPIPPGAPSSSKSWCRPSPASIACATTSSRRWRRRCRRRAARRCGSCSRSKSRPSTRRVTAPAKSIT